MWCGQAVAEDVSDEAAIIRLAEIHPAFWFNNQSAGDSTLKGVTVIHGTRNHPQ